MTMFSTPSDTPARVQIKSGTPRGQANGVAERTRINNILFGALMVLLLLAPLPFGSVRAFFWGLWACYLGLAGLAYAVLLARSGSRFRFTFAELKLPTLLMAATCAYLVVQMLPIGGVFGGFEIIAIGDLHMSSDQISIAPTQTALMLVRQLTYGVFFFLLLQVLRNDTRGALMPKLLLLICLTYALYAMFALQTGDTILGLQKWAYHGSATGPFVNRNSFATFLAFGTVIAAGQIGNLLLKQQQRHKDDGSIVNHRSNLALYALAYAFLMIVIIATQSRMGLFAAASGTLVVALLNLHAVRNVRVLVYGLPAAIALIAIGLLLFGQGLFERVGSLEYSANVRGDLYAQTLRLIAERPWTGFGGGTFELAFPLVHEAPVSPDRLWDRAHNTYLGLWSELGVVFGTLPILVIALIAWRLLSAILTRRGNWRAQAVGLGVIAVGAIHSLVDFSLEIQADTFVFLALIAGGLASIPARDKA